MAEQGMDFVCWQGDDIDIYIEVVGYDGLALDLTDCLVTWGLGSVTTAPATLIKTTANPAQIEMLSVIEGRIVVHLDPADTEGLSGPWRQELQLTDAFGSIETVMVGTVMINKASIKPTGTARAPLRVVGDDWAAG